MKKHIVDYKVYNVLKIKNKYGFRVHLTFDDGSETVKQFSGLPTRKEADKEKDKVTAQLVTNTFIFSDKQTLADFLEEWLENDIKQRTTANTYSCYSNAVKNHIVPILGKVYITELTRLQIKNMYLKIAQHSRRIAAFSKTVMNTSMKYAISQGKLIDNPASDITLPKADNINGTHARTIDTGSTLNLEQIVVLINASKDTGIYMPVLFAVLLGLRRGEIYGLKYSDVDFVRQKIHVRRQLGYAPNSDDVTFAPNTKTKQEIKLKTSSSDRILDIPDFLFEAILKERKIYEQNRSRRKKYFLDQDFICCSTYGKPRSPQYHYVTFKKILKDNGLPDIRWHDLRHSYATLLLKNDFNLKAISKLLAIQKR